MLGGFSQIIQALSHGLHILTGTPVVSVAKKNLSDGDGDGSGGAATTVCEVTTRDGRVFQSDYVVCTLPLV